MSCELCELERRIIKLEADNGWLKDQLLRTFAACKNLRQRAIRAAKEE